MVGYATNVQNYSHPYLTAWMMPYGSPTHSNLSDNSWQPVMATSYLASRGNPLGIVKCAVSATLIAQWLPTDPSGYYNDLVSRIHLAGGVKCCLWWQGETDVVAGTSEATYNTRLDTIANALYADTGAKLMVAKLQNWDNGTPANLVAIQNAITTAWADNPNVLTGPDLSDLIPSNGAHFSTDAEQIVIAGRWWNAIKAEFGW